MCVCVSVSVSVFALQIIFQSNNLPVLRCEDVVQTFFSPSFLQSFPAALVARVLDPRAGERVLDMCAAPGGK